MEQPAPAIAAVAGHFGRDVAAGLRSIERTVAAARAQGARLVVFPECALGGSARADARRDRAGGAASA